MRSLALISLLFAAPLTAQWHLQDANTTANLRGIEYVGNGVAWASGNNGTVLRTENSGGHWNLCTTPPNAEHLDFRGIQAFDNKTAIVMSSGKGDLSRLYKTADGCLTWTLLSTNPDKNGFWDALTFASERNPKERDGVLLGDPTRGHFDVYIIHISASANDKDSVCQLRSRPSAERDEAVFAASNSSLFFVGFEETSWFVTGGQGGARVFKRKVRRAQDLIWDSYEKLPVPLGTHTESSGGFSIAFATEKDDRDPDLAVPAAVGIIVGGDFTRPNQSTATATFTQDQGQHWIPAITSPHGYRSAVAYDSPHKTWITVGPNGTDISTDDGRNWHSLRPRSEAGDAADADQHWNALSLPFVVGPHSRIGTLEDLALPH